MPRTNHTVTNNIKTVQLYSRQLGKRLSRVKTRLVSLITQKPLTSFFGALVLLLVILTIVKILGTPKPLPEPDVLGPREVKIHQIGTAPSVEVKAKIDKAGVVTINAQTAGIVQAVNISEGDQVKQGQPLVRLSSTYSGANTASVQRTIAQKNLESAENNLPLQVDLVNQRREIAEKTDENADRLRELSNDSRNRLQDQLDLSQDILDILNENLEDLEAADPVDDALILSTRQLKAQSQAAVNSLRDSLAQLDYTKSSDNPPARLSDLQKETTLKSLELEVKGYELGVEIARLNYKLAKIGESLYYPSAFSAGTVDRVFVKPGQAVQPGTPLVSITSSTQSLKAIALVSSDLAKKIDSLAPSMLHIGDQVIEQSPAHVSLEPTDGNLHAVTWLSLGEYHDSLSQAQYISITVPVHADSISALPYVPIDSIIQTQDETFVFLFKPDANQNSTGTAQSQPITLGSVYGRYVQVTSGLENNDSVILDRAVISGDPVIVAGQQ